VTDPLNPYREDRPESPGEADQVKAGWLLMALRWFKVDLSADEARAAETVGAALSRWWRTKILVTTKHR
jgi:hypothetical protein